MISVNGQHLSERQIKEYLDRIEIERAEEISPEYLTRLQKAHVTHIPMAGSTSITTERRFF